MLEGFDEGEYTADGAVIRYDRGGSGPPLLLLHGYPQTRFAWRLAAPRLAEAFTVIAPDLPGYGASRGPGVEAGAAGYSKRAMARMLLALMRGLGFERFAIAGHDRGGRVGYRMCLDHPEAVERFAPIDIVPTIEVWEAMGPKQAIAAHHWAFLAQPSPVPERLIAADPDTYIGYLLDLWSGRGAALDPLARAAYIDQFRDLRVAWATCQDYRAGAGEDWVHDAEDRAAGRRISCPVQMLWAVEYLRFEEAALLQIWRRWCAGPLGVTALPCGHFVMEERPDEAASALYAFFSGA